MGNFRFAWLFNNCVLCTVASAFVVSTITPLPSYAAKPNININFNDIAFIARIENLIEKAKKYKGKMEDGKLLDVMIDIKQEVENYTGKRIDLDACFAQVEKDAKKSGVKINSDQIKYIKKKIYKADKKVKHKANFLFQCNIDSINFDQDSCDLDFEIYYLSKSKHKDEKEVCVPIRLSIGITCLLGGYFLSFIPHPLCQAGSKCLMAIGLEQCIEGTVSKLEEDEKDQKDKKKKENEFEHYPGNEPNWILKKG